MCLAVVFNACGRKVTMYGTEPKQELWGRKSNVLSVSFQPPPGSQESSSAIACPAEAPGQEGLLGLCSRAGGVDKSNGVDTGVSRRLCLQGTDLILGNTVSSSRPLS